MRSRTFVWLMAAESGIFGFLFISISVAGALGAQAAGAGEGHLRLMASLLMSTAGVLLVSLAMVNWGFRAAAGPALRSLLLADLLAQGGTGAVDTLVLVAGLVGPAAWLGVVIHAALAGGCAYFLVRPPALAGVREPTLLGGL